jgi:hypothetical protein
MGLETAAAARSPQHRQGVPAAGRPSPGGRRGGRDLGSQVRSNGAQLRLFMGRCRC